MAQPLLKFKSIEEVMFMAMFVYLFANSSESYGRILIKIFPKMSSLHIEQVIQNIL